MVHPSLYIIFVCLRIIYIYGCHCMCSLCIILTHTKRGGMYGGGGKNKQDPLMLLQEIVCSALQQGEKNVIGVKHELYIPTSYNYTVYTNMTCERVIYSALLHLCRLRVVLMYWSPHVITARPSTV